MKTISWSLLAALALIAGTVEAKEEQGLKTGHVKAILYEGNQKGPIGRPFQVIRNYAVPVYLGLPDQPYRIVGRLVDDRRGFDEISRAFSSAFSDEDHRMSYCANLASLRGAHAVVVTGNDQILKMLGLSQEDIHDNSPLFDQKDKVTLIVQFLNAPPPPPPGARMPPPPPKPAF